jgi:tRNA(Ile)-lysidine synthase
MLEASWIERFLAFRTLFVGLSGGLDSIVLVHVLSSYPQLYKKLHVIHVHHGLSMQADNWQGFCQVTCERLGVPFQVKHVNCRQISNQEAVARAARYQVFDECVGEKDALLLAHHQSDQAETLLLNLMRGAGIDGLCGMWQERQRHHYPIFRPFLTCSREKLEAYAHKHHLNWVEDESNQDISYTRNYIRHEILPRLQQRWPQAKKNLAKVTTHAQATERNLYELACMDYPLLTMNPTELDFSSLQGSIALSSARLANLVWFWLKQHGVAPLNQKMVQRVMEELVLRKRSSGLKVTFLNHEVRSHQKKLYLRIHTQHEKKYGIWTDFPSTYSLPDGLGYLVVEKSNEGLSVPANAQIEVRFRCGGEQFDWHRQTKSLKKLWQAWHVPAWERAETPLIYINGKLAVVVGWAVSDLFYAKDLDESPVQIKWVRGKNG